MLYSHFYCTLFRTIIEQLTWISTFLRAWALASLAVFCVLITFCIHEQIRNVQLDFLPLKFCVPQLNTGAPYSARFLHMLALGLTLETSLI